jgi:hypothetical protein
VRFDWRVREIDPPLDLPREFLIHIHDQTADLTAGAKLLGADVPADAGDDAIDVACTPGTFR